LTHLTATQFLWRISPQNRRTGRQFDLDHCPFD
jgi:hypothetical protein